MRCLVTAIGSMSAETVIRAIAGQPDTVVLGCNMHPKEWSTASRLVERFHQVPSARNAAAYISRLLEICKSERISHVVPLTDLEVDVLSTDRQRFDEMGITLCISPHPAIRLARDKLAIHDCFARHPRIRPITTMDLREVEHLDFPYPLLAKPRSGRSSEGLVNIPDAAALEFWCGRLSKQDYVVQPLKTGDIFVVDVVRQPDGRGSAAMTRRELLRTANGAGMTVHMQRRHACNALALEAAEIVGLCGCVNMEFLVVDGTPLLMDVNPRFSAGVVFSVMSGYDMVSNHLRCFDGGQVEHCMSPPDKVYARSFVEHSIED